MSTSTRISSSVIRVFIAVIFLFNALIPSVSVVHAQGSGASNSLGIRSAIGQVRALASQPASYFQPPAIRQPQESGPEGDEPESKVPPREKTSEEVEFLLTASPGILAPNGTTEFTIFIRNNSEKDLYLLDYVDQLEDGLVYVSRPGDLVGYSASKNEVRYTILRLAAGEETSLGYTVQAASRSARYTKGEMWVHTAELKAKLGGLKLKAGTNLGFDVSGVSEGGDVARLDRAGGWKTAGDVSVYMSENAVPTDSVLVVSPTEKEKGPPLQFKVEAYRSAAAAKDADGALVEQELAIQNQQITSFSSPVFMEVKLDAVADLDSTPAGKEPFVATYDEARQIWIKVPILETDYEANSVIVETNHFSTWGAGLGDSLPQNGANVLLFEQPYTNLFTGAARYSIPVWAPPGRAGMAPDISLSYSSSTMDGVLGDVQGSWVGAGWNIDGVEVVRKITTDENGYGYVNQFALTLNGTLYELAEDTVNAGRYYTIHDSFLYIERHNYAFGNAKDGSTDPVNQTGEWWEVVTEDGTRYRLGWNPDSEQLALMYGYACTTDGQNCLTPDGAYASSGYAGLATDMVAMRWRVDRVTDTHGNYMEYSYYESQPDPATTIAAFDRESYLDSIRYTGFDQPGSGTQYDLDPAYEVEFTYGDRATIGDVPVEFNIWDNIDSRYLESIDACYGPCGESGSIAARSYEFGYSLAAAPNTNGTLILTSLAISGGGFTDNGQAIPETDAPLITFTYDNKPNRAVSGGDDPFTYPRLVSIDNGFGGLISYTYETDGRGTDSWYNYRVKEVHVDSGVDTAAKQSYIYETPIYTGQGSYPNLGELIGYTKATESQLDFNNNDAVIVQTRHTFGTIGLDVGRELLTEWLEGATVLRKVTRAYATDNSQAPYFGWNFRYLHQTANYEKSGGALVLTSKSSNTRDPGNGNLLLQADYLGSSLYRKTYYEYLTNPDPDHYILDRVSRALLVNASNQILADTRYHYDGAIATAPTTGDLTLIQRLTGTGDQTADVASDYDVYGNQIATRAYTGYGTVNAPGGSYQATSTAYDTTLYTYPVTVTNALEQSSSADYLYTLGIPYRSTDPNGWSTTTSYDGFGRALSIRPPGLGQAGVWYSYPEPDVSGVVTAPYAVELQVLDTPASTFRSVWGVYDGLGRMLQTQVYDADQAQLLVSESQYNAQGLVDRQSLPFYASGAGGEYRSGAAEFTETAFDALGRVVSVTQPGNIVTSSSYIGLTVTVTDPNENKVSRTSDGLGRMKYVTEYTDTQSIYASTQYFYDAADRLVGVTDAQSNSTSIQYDWLGRKTGMDDPDMGVWTYSYNSIGNLAQQTDARGQALSFQYDALNRLIQKNDVNLSSVLTTYTYGSAQGEIGFRTAMNDVSGATSWSYADYGRTVSETRPAGSMTTHADWLGRPLTVTYPDSEVLSYSYDALGRPQELSSSQNPGIDLIDLAYNALGQISTQSLGNGVTVTNTYDSGTHRMSNRSADLGQTSLLDLTYTYQSNGNIASLTDGLLDETHSYQYDFLNRLTLAEATSDEEYVYRQQFVYDKVGNITQASDWDVASYPNAYIEPEPREGVHLASLQMPVPALQEGPTNTPTPTSTYTPISTNTPYPTNTPTMTPTPGVDGYTAVMLHMDGADGSTSFVDETGKTWTAAGNAQIDTAQYEFGGASGLFDGSGDYVDTPDHADFDVAAGDFTIDFWVRRSADGAVDRICGHGTAAGSGAAGSVQIKFNADDTVTGSIYDGAVQYAAISIGTITADSTWHHIALVRNGNTMTLYIDGTADGTDDVTGVTVNNAAAKFTIGRWGEYNGDYFTGWMDEFRFSKGIARWTGNFTPPVAPYSSGPTPTPLPTYTPTSTATLPPMGQYLTGYWDFENVTPPTVPDAADGDNPGTLANGAAIITDGASGDAVSLDGINDYVSIPHHADLVTNGSFSLSAWIRPSALVTSRTQYLVHKGGASNDYGLITLEEETGDERITGGQLAFLVGDLSPSRVLGPVLPVDTWTLVTGVYDATGGRLRLYLNGVLAATQNVTGTLSMSSGALYFSPTSNPYQGALDEVRFYNRALTGSEVQELIGYFPTPTPLPSATPTATSSVNTPTPTALPIGGLPWGTGDDGDLTVSTSSTFNINTQNSNGRTCADGGDAVSYNVLTLGSTAAVLNASPSSGCLNAGDEVLLVHLHGSSATDINAGEIDYLRVSNVNNDTVTFTTPKTKWFGDSWRSDHGIGVDTGDILVGLFRVPNYEDVAINGTLTGKGFNNYKNGVMAFRVAGELTGTGTIHMNSKGFRGSRGNLNGYGRGGHASLEWGGSGGGAGHTTPGKDGGYETRHGNGGGIYGNPQLDPIFLGSGGGQASTIEPDHDPAGGGNGGGIILIAGQDIDFQGTISSTGQDKPTSPTSGYKGGAGSGGSIRIEGQDIDLNNAIALGGSPTETYGAGGQGRIALYYQNSLSITSSEPAAYSGQIGQTPVPTPTPTPISFVEEKWGTGADGDLTVASGQTFNIHTQFSGTRSCADGVSYEVLQVSESTVTLGETPLSGCLNPGDEVLLMHMYGTGSNIGNHDFLKIGQVIGNIAYFTAAKVNFYGDGSDNDTGVGDTQKVALYRVPNYDDVQIDGTLTGSGFNNKKNGIMIFRVAAELSGTGTISMDSRGYPGSNGYGRGGNASYIKRGSGGGAGYTTPGKPGGYDLTKHGGGGGTYGNPQLEPIFMGSGGGQAYCADVDPPGGGSGGGMIQVIGKTIDFQGLLSAKGQDKYTVSGCPWYGGAGSGGSIRIDGQDVSLNTANILGGSSTSSLGAGGKGRVAVYYENTFSANFTPGYLQKLDAADTIFNDDFEIGDLSAWSASVTDGGDLSASESADYWGKYGLLATLNDTNDLYVLDNTPDGEKHYRARFYLDPNSIDMDTNDVLELLAGFSGSTQVFRLQIRTASGTYQLRVGILDDTETWTDSDWNSIQNDWNAIEIDYQALAYDGELSLYIDGALKQTLTRIENDTRTLDSVRLGAMGVDAGTSGALYIDDFDSRRFSFIGTLLDPGLDPDSQSEPSPLLNNLVSWWSLDEQSGTRADLHGSNDLTDNNTVLYATGQQGNAADLERSNVEFLSHADNADFSLGDEDFTFGGWVKAEYLNYYRFYILAKKNGYSLFYHESAHKFTFTTTYAGLQHTTVPTTDTWYFVVVWHDSVTDQIGIQVNGTAQTQSYSNGVVDNSDDFGLGAYIDNGSAAHYWDGLIDEFFFYKRILTTEERAWLYNDGDGRKYGEINPEYIKDHLKDNLISWWSLDETSGTRDDLHGANDLTDNNTVLYATGRKGNAADFERDNSEFLSHDDNADFSLGDDDFTFGGWISGETLAGANRYIIAKHDDYLLLYDTTTNRLRFIVSGGTSVSTNTAPTTNTWYFVVVWHDSITNQIGLQVNDGTDFTVAHSTGISDNAHGFGLGGYVQSGIGYHQWDGLIDEFFFYKRVLTTDERSWLYNEGSGRSYSELAASSSSTEGWLPRDYTYDEEHPHAVASVSLPDESTDTYIYDENGNMTCRQEDGVWFEQSYNAENRIAAIVKRDGSCEGTIIESWSYVYDGDGVRVGEAYFLGTTLTLTKTIDFGGAYETHSDGTVRKYYSLAEQTVALRAYDPGTSSWSLSYFLSDHLGSTLAVLDASGNVLSEQRYLPFGEVREDVGTITQTDFGYTFQRANSYIKLLDYRSRWYDPQLGRFIQSDSIIPNLANPQSLNRFSYVINNPIRYTDPTGHRPIIDEDENGRPIVDHNWRPGRRRNDDGGIIVKIFKCWNDPECIMNVAVDTQNIATTFSVTGGMIETVATVFGCMAGFEAGVIPGCIAGFGVGNKFHHITTDPIENWLSRISLGATIRYDLLVGTTGFDESGTLIVSEGSATSLFTTLAGEVNNSGVIDGLIDIYASRYNDGKSPGIYEVLEKTGIKVFGETLQDSHKP